MGTVNSIMETNKLLEEYANSIPAKGMHIGYLDKVSEIMDLYGEVLDIMKEEQSPENMNKVIRLRDGIRRICRSVL